jgi:protein gp37
MSDKTAIEWCSTVQADGTVTAGSTWNPIRGTNARHTCARISPGCLNCYAATMTRRGLMGTAPIDYGTGETPNDPARLDKKALLQPLTWKTPRKVFVCSMTDLFGTWVPGEWIEKILDVMMIATQHSYILLTKRPTRMRDILGGVALPPHIWVGTTIESDRYAWRADRLRQMNCAVRWISAEPLLSGLPSLDLTGIDWLVAGGESGPKARPMHPSWPRDLRDRCQSAGVPFFFKQHGNYVSATDCPDETTSVSAIVAVNEDGSYVDERSLTEQSHGPLSMRTALANSVFVMRVGNHKSGRLLDGRTWDEYPTVATAGAVS